MGLDHTLYHLDGPDAIRHVPALMERYGKKLFYFIFPHMSLQDADTLMNHAHKHWESD